jgi:hypothetical protein
MVGSLILDSCVWNFFEMEYVFYVSPILFDGDLSTLNDRNFISITL